MGARDVREQTLVVRRTHIICNEHSNNKSVDGDDTGHDDRNQGLAIVSGCGLPMWRRSHPRTFMIKSDLNVPTPEIPMPDFAVPYAAPIAVALGVVSCLCLVLTEASRERKPTPEDHLREGQRKI